MIIKMPRYNSDMRRYRSCKFLQNLKSEKAPGEVARTNNSKRVQARMHKVNGYSLYGIPLIDESWNHL